MHRVQLCVDARGTGTRVHQYVHAWVQWAHGCMSVFDSRVHPCIGARVHWVCGCLVHKYTGAPVHGCIWCMGAPVHGYTGIWCVGAFHSGVPGCAAAQRTGTWASRPGPPATAASRRAGGGLTSPLSPRGGADGSTPTPSSPAWPPSWLTTPGRRGAASAAWPPAAATPATRSGTPAAGPAPGGRPPGPPPPPLGCSMNGVRPGRPPLGRGYPQNPHLALNRCHLPYLFPSRGLRARSAGCTARLWQ